jgi:hypothetical protein
VKALSEQRNCREAKICQLAPRQPPHRFVGAGDRLQQPLNVLGQVRRGRGKHLGSSNFALGFGEALASDRTSLLRRRKALARFVARGTEDRERERGAADSHGSILAEWTSEHSRSGSGRAGSS